MDHINMIGAEVAWLPLPYGICTTLTTLPRRCLCVLIPYFSAVLSLYVYARRSLASFFFSRSLALFHFVFRVYSLILAFDFSIYLMLLQIFFSTHSLNELSYMLFLIKTSIRKLLIQYLKILFVTIISRQISRITNFSAIARQSWLFLKG